MANASNSITLTNSYNGTFTLSTAFNENNTNIENNTSNITVSGTIARGTGRFDTSYNNMLRVYWHDNKNNTDVFVTEIAVQDLYNSGASATASGTINVEHNSDGNLSGYAFATWEKVSTASAVPASNSVSTSWTELTYIPRQANVTGYNDFNDEQNPTITYNNPGGFRINARLEFGGTYINRLNVPNTGNYTFELTDDERKLLRQKCTGNSMTVRGVIATCIGGTTENYWSWLDKTMTIVNGNPTFDNFNFADVNEKTIALTGDDTSIIKGYSNIKVTIPSSMKATANKEATMNKYRASIGTANPVDITYSSDNEVSGIVNNADSSTINVYAIDSRNNSKLVSKQATNFINYNVVTKGNIDVLRTNGVSEDVTLKINGTYSNIDFGQIVNSIKSAQYRYRVKGTNEWSDYKDLSITTSGNNFSYNGLIKGDTESLGFDVGNSYEIEVLVKDELSEVTFTDTFGSGIPNLALAKKGVGIMGKYDEEVGGPFQVEGKNPFQKQISYTFNASTRQFNVIAWTDTKVIMESNNTIGNYFTWDSINKRIILNKNVKCLKFSVGYNWYNNQLSGDRALRIYRNGQSLMTFGYVNAGTNYYAQVQDTFISKIDYNKGDYFELYVNCGNSGTEKIFDTGVFLMIEVIE